MNLFAAVKKELEDDERTIAWLARKTGKQRVAMYQILKGNPTLGSISTIARALKMKPSELIKKAEDY